MTEESEREFPGERLRRLRLKKGMTLQQFGDRLGCTGANVSFWESLRHNIPSYHLVNATRIFGVSIDYLMTGKEAPRLAAIQRAILLSPKRDERLIAMVRATDRYR